MKKILLATTALAAVSVASVAQAQESQMMSAAGNDITIGGFYEFGWASNDDDAKGDTDDRNRTYGDSELFIDFENTSDNGLTYGVQVDLEIVDSSNHLADQDNVDTPDEASMYLKGNFGEFHLGHDDNAFGRFLTWAPVHDGATGSDDNIYGVSRQRAVGDLVAQDDVTDSLAPYTASYGGGAGDAGSAYNDDAKITYITPSVAGFKVGVSMEDDDGDNDARAFGLSYNTELGGMDVRLTAANYGNGGDNSNEASETSVGVEIGAGDFTFTVARYTSSVKGTTVNLDGSDQNGDDTAGKGGHVTGESDVGATEIGIGYKVSDALSVGIARTAGSGEVKGATDATDVIEDEATNTSVSASYNIAPGLKTTLAYNIFSNEREAKGTAPGATPTAARVDEDWVGTSKNDGTEIVWQIEFSF